MTWKDPADLLTDFNRLIMQVYHHGEGTPGFVHDDESETSPGHYGSPPLDPIRFEQAFAVFVYIKGLPDEPVDWVTALCGESDYIRFRDREPDPTPGRGGKESAADSAAVSDEAPEIARLLDRRPDRPE